MTLNDSKKNLVLFAAAFIALFVGVIVGVKTSDNTPEVVPADPVAAKVVFRVDSLGSDGQPGNTTVTYSPDGRTNVEVGEIGDTFSVELDDSVLASLTFTNGEGTLATAYTYRQGVETDQATVGPNSWNQVKN